MFQGQAENRYQAQDGWPGFFFLYLLDCSVSDIAQIIDLGVLQNPGVLTYCVSVTSLKQVP